MTTITVDYEHNCEKWWAAAREEAKGNPPQACVGLLDSCDSIECIQPDVDVFVAWAEQLPGWNEKPFIIN